jgi:transglutaminase-like putative cysteine protease
MSAAGTTISVGPRFEPSRRGGPLLSDKAVLAVRATSFTALAAYGVIRWATLLEPAPTIRLIGLVGLSLAVVVLVPALRRLGPPPAIVAACVIALLSFPVAGLSWGDFWHLRVAAAAREIARGLSALPGSYVPYTGAGHGERLVILLGAAILLLDAAIVLAFAPRRFGDGRRATAGLPLIALAVVPSTLLRPQFPYLQGLLLFVLLVSFLWVERASRQKLGPVLVLLAAAALAGGLAAPRLDRHHALLNYRTWAGTTVHHGRLDAFNWNQSYGPLRWPHSGHPVMTVSADRADYWKAEDLDVFNGTAWVAARLGGAPLAGPEAAGRIRWDAAWVASQVYGQQLPGPTNTARARFSQALHVDVTGMRSPMVIAAGDAQAPAGFPGATLPGSSPGTWLAEPALTPGGSYTVLTYSPRPSPAALNHDRGRYPSAALAPYTTLELPLSRSGGGVGVHFPLFGLRGAALRAGPLRPRPAAPAILASAYAPVYGLVRRLRARAATQYAYVKAVLGYLGRGFSYTETPPVRRYPLVDFLLRDKAGYCQQFSGAMALLLRMGGVPARVASGFTPGARGAGGQWIVTDIDAHAWVEVWFPKYGWVRFDPTPKSAPARGGGTNAAITKVNIAAANQRNAKARRPGFSAGSSSSSAHASRSGSGSGWLVVLPAAAIAGLLALSIFWVLAPHPDPDTRLAELERALRRTGRPLGPDVTLAMLERRFRDSPAAASYIRELRLARYGVAPEAADPRGRRALREQLGHGLGLGGRLRALWALPPTPSVLRDRRAA